jgi:hypothetical protein
MYKAGGVDQFENIAVPEGDPGEQLVAYLLLAPIVCQLNALPNAIAYIAQAHELAVRLAGQNVTYRPKTASKFARLEFELQGRTEIVLLSLINNVLVMPPVGPGDLSKLLLTEGMAINLTNLSVAHLMLRLPTRRLAASDRKRFLTPSLTLKRATRPAVPPERRPHPRRVRQGSKGPSPLPNDRYKAWNHADFATKQIQPAAAPGEASRDRAFCCNETARLHAV